jgi:DNA helicase-2/ATP-dependent DNA helicase PcrA
MTMHNAKGLEFPVVFITGLEDGLFPLARAYDDPAQLEEERRLFYVGITRAEEKLYLLHAEQRMRNGERMQSRPSGFLDGIPDELFDRKMTVKARSSGRAFLGGLTGGRAGGGGWGQSSWSKRDAGGRAAGAGAFNRTLDTDEGWAGSSLRAGTPAAVPGGSTVRRRPGGAPPDPAEESQDAARLAPGARVTHRKFGTGTIAELTGTGRDAKVRIDFDDESIGRKTLVVAQANLEPALE